MLFPSDIVPKNVKNTKRNVNQLVFIFVAFWTLEVHGVYIHI